MCLTTQASAANKKKAIRTTWSIGMNKAVAQVSLAAQQTHIPMVAVHTSAEQQSLSDLMGCLMSAVCAGGGPLEGCLVEVLLKLPSCTCAHVSIAVLLSAA